ncbi:hypothetical protein GCK32_020621, partial [Trichostrongylus colubriformis]
QSAFTRSILMYITCLILLAIVCSPLAIYIDWGCSYLLAANIFLYNFAWVSGITHAWIMITAYFVISFKDFVMSLTENTRDMITDQPKNSKGNPDAARTSRDQMEIEIERIEVL